MLIAYTGRVEFDGIFRLLCKLPVRVLLSLPIRHPVCLVISAAGTHIFTRGEIAQARCGIVNLHLAPLPEFRGRYSATHAILNGADEYGVTLHYVDEGIDTGPIIAEHRWPIGVDDTAGSLRERARAEGERLLVAMLPGLLDAALDGRRLPAAPQDEKRARYYDKNSLPEHDGSELMARALAC